MPRSASPCSNSGTSQSHVTSPADRENLRRQIVGLALKRDKSNRPKTPLVNNENIQPPQSSKSSKRPTIIARARTKPVTMTSKTARQLSETPHPTSGKPLFPDSNDKLATNRSKSAMISSEIKQKPKIVRFRMEEHTIGKHKTPIVKITDTFVSDKRGLINGKIDPNSSVYEVRGNALAVRKEGLKGLMEVKDVNSENERRQNTLQASLKIFRRRIKLNQDKFIQPNESTTEDYVIHTARTPFCDVNNTSSLQEPRPAPRPLSSDEHVRILRSALHNKHNGVSNAVSRTQIENDNEESYKNIKCSYRLPENLNWSKEVSFKDIKDDSIPNVKTYVLEEDTHPHSKYKKTSTQNSVTLNTHNLNVHNSITQIHNQKVKVGDCDVSFDPRFLTWLEESLSNSKGYRGSNFLTEETFERCSTPSVKRRLAAKT